MKSLAFLLGLSAALAAASLTNSKKRKSDWPPYTGPGRYYIINQATGTVLDLSNGDPQAGTPIIGKSQVIGNLDQIWQVAAAAPSNGTTNTILLINANTGSIAMCPTTSQSAVGGQYPINSSTLLYMVPNPDNSVQFQNVENPNICLDLSGSSPANGTSILCYPCHPGMGVNQNWILSLA